ncbi:SsgA family sporulation/cell division regulator [Streptosporangium roseum]|uniref:SsgA family sporulation/cell division regulator n=1 Tax=Streptosporangium roseum TaxID=2001 RepID=UPI0004CD2ADE|nr:SsgA family sporulation/cell division regulator [Streptosporangium roseum]
MSRSVTQGLTLWAADRPDYPLAAVLTYSADDPYAVRLAFVQGSRETVAYVFARGLLADGLYDPVGEGDVMVGPHEDHEPYLVITLRPEDGYPFALYVVRSQIEAFVDRAYRLVAMGRERVDVDAVVARILAEVTP